MSSHTRPPLQTHLSGIFGFRILTALTGFVAALAILSGCSAGKQGLLQITPQQYFYSAKEKLETIDERNYEVKDLDEIIRVLENAEKDAKSGEIIDKSRLYLTLLNTLKARKQYQGNLLKGQYLANRAEPFYVLDIKPVQETLRLAKKWLRACEAGFKTSSVFPDLQFVKGMYYKEKMLTQYGEERRESLWTAVEAFRRCMGASPDYQSDFRLFGQTQTPREVRLHLAECLALGGEVGDAFCITSEYGFAPSMLNLTNPTRTDYPWFHIQGLILAMMGKQEAAAKALSRFKIVPPQDYPVVEQALWVLEGVFDRLKEETKEDRFGMEARIVASMLKKLKGPFSKEKYTTAANIFPRWLPGDLAYFDALVEFMNGNFETTKKILAPLRTGGLMSRQNRNAARVLALETALFAKEKVSDDILEEVLAIALEKGISPIMKERIGFLLARYVMSQDTDFKSGKLEGEGQTFVKTFLGKPWAISLKFQRGKPVKPERKPRPRKAEVSEEEGEGKGKRDPSSILAEVYANRPDDWIVSANLNLIELPQMALLGKGRIVGREEEGKGWLFKGEDIDELKRGGRYLAVFEFDNSESEKSLQGILFQP